MEYTNELTQGKSSRSERRLRDRLKKKLKAKGKEPIPEPSVNDIFSSVSNMLKQNPDMLNQVNKTINKMFENQDVMSKLMTEISQNLNVQDQTLHNNSETDLPDASEKKSEQ